MHRPFEVLDQWIRDGRLRLSEPEAEPGASASPPEAERPADPPAEPTDAELFRAAMEGVRPLGWNAGAVPVRETAAVPDHGEDDDALRALEDFCRTGSVGPEHSGEYVEHFAHPAGRLYLSGLRSGRFAIQAHLDLHGLTLDAARKVVDLFVRESVRAGYSCVRIVHGRGRHSAGGRPLLKENVERWLRHRRMARYVIAYTSARAVDGGGGAVYVLLRRRSR